MKIGILGAGQIVPYHLTALKSVGFDLQLIGASRNSTNASRLAKQFDIPTVLDSATEILEKIHLIDCLLIATSSPKLFEFLELVAPFDIPVLVEKPVFARREHLLHEHLISRLNSRVQVGYNRRFYESINAFKENVLKVQGGSLAFTIPELSNQESHTLDKSLSTIIENTVHMFDLLFFINDCFDPDLFQITSKSSENLPFSIGFRSQNLLKDIDLKIYFSVPDNYSITFRSPGVLLELKPLEIFRKYRGIEVIEPTSNYPLRSYKPIQELEIVTSMEAIKDRPIKPGFRGQALEFLNFVHTRRLTRGASLLEATQVSRMAFKVVDEITSRFFSAD